MSELYESLISDIMTYTGLTSREAVIHRGGDAGFMRLRKDWALSDADWYREFPIERICRQAWYNTEGTNKKLANQFILSMIPPNQPLKILDFGCGIGVTAFALAEKGHHVTAMDIRGSGPLEFLKWRAAKYNVPMTIIESEGGIPRIVGMFDVIVAMDSIEHVNEWKDTLSVLASHLNFGSVLYSNNATFYDLTQPEHYDVHPTDFIKECVDVHLMPQTQISYIKMSERVVDKEVQVHA